MNDEQTKALLGALESQRNAAFNALANAQAELIVAKSEITRLRQTISMHEANQPKEGSPA